MIDTTLIYTYKEGLNHIPTYIPNDLILSLYRECINNNKQYHRSIMYTTEEHKNLFVNDVDSIKIIDENYDIYFQDDLKFYVLQKETPPYTLIDGDIILDNKLKIGNENVVYEKKLGEYPTEDYFLKMLEYLDKYKVKKSFPYWKTFEYTYNLGILHVNDNTFVNSFTEEYTKLKKWYKDNIDLVQPEIKKKVVIEMATCTYFFSMFLEVHKFTIGVLNKENSFTHYSGTKQKLKFLKEIGAFKNTLI